MVSSNQAFASSWRTGPHRAEAAHAPVSRPRERGALTGVQAPLLGARVETDELPAHVQDVLSRPGMPLDEEPRGVMESRFRRDFSTVRVHTGDTAAESARRLGAKAYTVGQDIVFGSRGFTTSTFEGREVLAHELAHTIQQRGDQGSRSIHRPDSALEENARSVAAAVASGQIAPAAFPSTNVGVACTPDEDARAQAILEAREAIARSEREEQEEEEEEAAEREAATRPAGMKGTDPFSLVADEPLFDYGRDIDAELSEIARKRTPDEPEYWAEQEDLPLDLKIEIASETKYVRKWREERVSGVGDQGDRIEYVKDFSWKLTGPALLAFVRFMTGTRPTAFERKIANGQHHFDEGFTIVNAGGQLGYYTEFGGSGDRNHVVYERDGSEYSHTHSEAALVNMGLGPIDYMLGGASLLKAGATLGRAGVKVSVRGARAVAQVAGRAARATVRAVPKAVTRTARNVTLATRLATSKVTAGAMRAGDEVAAELSSMSTLAQASRKSIGDAATKTASKTAASRARLSSAPATSAAKTTTKTSSVAGATVAKPDPSAIQPATAPAMTAGEAATAAVSGVRIAESVGGQTSTQRPAAAAPAAEPSVAVQRVAVVNRMQQIVGEVAAEYDAAVLAGDVATLGQALYPRQIALALRGNAMMRGQYVEWQARVRFALDRLVQPHIGRGGYMGLWRVAGKRGLRRGFADFRGADGGLLSGMTIEITTVRAVAEHVKRSYLEKAVILTY